MGYGHQCDKTKSVTINVCRYCYLNESVVCTCSGAYMRVEIGNVLDIVFEM